MKKRETNTYEVGNARITRIDDLTLPGIPPSYLLPDWNASAAAAGLSRLHADDTSGDDFVLSVHSWLIQTPRNTILVDTACGNNKERPSNLLFHRLNTPYLCALQAAGVRPDQVDAVVTTHLHVDHVGWNTTLQGGRWTPTFPRARHYFSELEYDYYADPVNVAPASKGVFEDSVQPIVDAGLVEFVSPAGREILDGIRLHRSGGHSRDHLSITFSSNSGEEAFFCGDVFHHPLQVSQPEWNSVFCEFPDEARAARRHALSQAADRHALVLTPHFSGTSAGRVSRDGDEFRWSYC